MDQIYHHWTKSVNYVKQPTAQVVNGGYPAIKIGESADMESYFIVAPGLGKPNAKHSIGFDLGGEGVTNPYSASDPFTQQELINFTRVVSSMRFPTK